MAPRTILTLLLLSSTIAIHGEPLKISVLSVDTSVTAIVSGSGLNCSQFSTSSVFLVCAPPSSAWPGAFAGASAAPGSLNAAGALLWPLPPTPLEQTATASFSEDVLITGATGTGYLAFVIFPVAQVVSGNIGVSANGKSYMRSFQLYPPVYIDGVAPFQFGSPFGFSIGISETTDNSPHPFYAPRTGFLTITPALLEYQIFDTAPSYCGPTLPGEPPRTPPTGPCSGATLPFEGSLFAPEPSAFSLMLIAALVVSGRLRRRRTAVRATPPDTSSNPDAAAF